VRIPIAILSAAGALAITAIGLVTVAASTASASLEVNQPNMAATEIAVTASEWAFEPSSIVIQAGKPVLFQLTTGGELSHNLTIDAPSGEMRSPTFRPGEPVSWDVTIEEPGTYTFFCSFTSAGGHRAQGMEGTIEVTAGGAQVVSSVGA